jgi:hypothetical protein
VSAREYTPKKYTYVGGINGDIFLVDDDPMPDVSGDYVLYKNDPVWNDIYKSDIHWWEGNNGDGFSVRIEISPQDCPNRPSPDAQTPSQVLPSCDQCTESCAVTAWAGWHMYYRIQPRPTSQCWFYGYNPDASRTQEAVNDDFCPACQPVPVCSPSGLEFEFFDLRGSDEVWSPIFENNVWPRVSDVGGRACDANSRATRSYTNPTDPANGPYTGPTLPDHRNIITITVQ